jgi:cytochrome c peroxidase
LRTTLRFQTTPASRWLLGTLSVGFALAAAAPFTARATSPDQPEAEQFANLEDQELETESAPGPLSSLPIPMPKDLSKYIKNVNAAKVLGKALFWDMQAGSDGLTACATCHWHAGADVRQRNQIAPHGPGKPDNDSFRGTNYTLKMNDFPLRKLSDPRNRKSSVVRDTSEVVGSQGVIKRDLVAVRDGNPRDLGTTMADPVFHVSGANGRQVTGRNAPTTINSVFFDRLFWDGRAYSNFNGVNPFGETDPDAKVWSFTAAEGLKQKRILIERAALASQAVGPANNNVEMSWNGRAFAAFGRKMLSLRPLALQSVAVDDSLLGPYAVPRSKGLKDSLSYATLIRDAFQPEWWSSSKPVDGEYSQMEANFSLFWGLAIMMYESTLVSDQAPYDRFAAGDANAISASAKQGLEIFMNQGKCINCHSGPEFAGGTISTLRPSGRTEKRIEFMVMGNKKPAFYDGGFYNIGVRPTEEDLGVGADGPFGPLSLTGREMNGTYRHPGHDICDTDRIAIKGAFKSPTLRNVTLTGPFFHNGGTATLEQVIEFYARGGDFHERNIDDLDPDIEVLDEIVGNPERIQNLVDFLKTLTDPRVEYQRPPFDHPELVITNGHQGSSKGVALDKRIGLPATGSRGGARLKRFEEILVDGVPN